MSIFGRIFSADRSHFSSLKNVLGFTPSNLSVYHCALRHKSAATEIKNGVTNSNERLEYLGDAVLGAVIADYVFKKFPYREEGFLTEMRSKIVSRDNLNKLSRKLGLDELIENDRDTAASRSMHGDALEALIGAIYLDKGYRKAKQFILDRLVKHHMDIDELEATEKNFKSRLIEWVQREKKSISFDVIEEKENGKGKLVKVQAMVSGEGMGCGSDFSKKRAEQLAAEETCKMIGI